MNNYVCLVCLGSNIDGEYHLDNARKALQTIFVEVSFGKPIVTKAEGDIVQPDYWNQAARFVTPLTSGEVIDVLKQIEIENGRTPEDKMRGLVPLDIDLLIYGGQVLKSDDLQKEYVQQALRTITVE